MTDNGIVQPDFRVEVEMLVAGEPTLEQQLLIAEIERVVSAMVGEFADKHHGRHIPYEEGWQRAE